MQKIHPLASLGAKLFYLTAALVLITVSVNSWQNARMFQRDLERFSEDTTLLQAQGAAHSASTILENWASQISLVMHTAQGATDAGRGELMTKFLGASSELTALHLIKTAAGQRTSLAFATTPQQDDPRFGGDSPASLAGVLREASLASVPVGDGSDANSNATNNANAMVVVSLAAKTKLPLLAVALPFNYGNKDRIWAVLVLWQDRLNGVLPTSALVTSLLVNGSGDVLSSPRRSDPSTSRTIQALLGLQKGTQATSGFARFGDDSNADGVTSGSGSGNGNGDWFGAYTKVPKQALYVFVRRDAKALHAATVNLIKRTVLWAWIFVLFAIMASFLGASRLTKQLRLVTEATRRIASGDFTTRVPKTSSDEISVLSHSVADMGTQIQSLLTAQIAKVRLETELATAKMVQHSFFPRQMGDSRAFKLAADYHPASECGGDWWGFFPAGEGREFLCIADATGHGAPAAMVTAMAYTTSAVLSRAVATNEILRLTPAALLNELNAVLWAALKGQVGMTFFASVIDEVTGTLTFCNAGHNFPVLLPAHPGKRLATVHQGGSPLGFEPDALFRDETIQVQAGDKLFLYTDGLIECESPEGQMWGKRAMMKVLETHRVMPPLNLVAEIMTTAFSHYGVHPLSDDVTVIVAEILARKAA